MAPTLGSAKAQAPSSRALAPRARRDPPATARFVAARAEQEPTVFVVNDQVRAVLEAAPADAARACDRICCNSYFLRMMQSRGIARSLNASKPGASHASRCAAARRLSRVQGKLERKDSINKSALAERACAASSHPRETERDVELER